MKCRDFQTEIIPAADYHSRPEISHSAAKCFSKEGSWDYYHRYVLRTLPDRESPALNLGRAFHAAMEDQETWEATFVEEPTFVTIAGSREQINRRKPSHRQAIEEWETEQRLAGKTILRSGEVNSVREMTLSVLDNPAAVEYLQATGAQEIAGFAVEETTGLAVKALADLWLPEWSEGSTVVDFKTTEDSTPEEWARKAMSQWGYNFQAGWYTDVFQAERFAFIVVRSKEPWECWVRECNPSVIRQARKQNLETLRQIKARKDADDWHNNGWGAEYPMIDEEAQQRGN